VGRRAHAAAYQAVEEQAPVAAPTDASEALDKQGQSGTRPRVCGGGSSRFDAIGTGSGAASTSKASSSASAPTCGTGWAPSSRARRRCATYFARLRRPAASGCRRKAVAPPQFFGRRGSALQARLSRALAATVASACCRRVGVTRMTKIKRSGSRTLIEGASFCRLSAQKKADRRLTSGHGETTLVIARLRHDRRSQLRPCGFSGLRPRLAQRSLEQ
jgi:hypothetical protein